MTTAPLPRVRLQNDELIRHDGDYVLYWMTSSRRMRWNFALQHARDRARRLGVPLLVLEALRIGHRWSSERVHSFVLDGMADNARACDKAGVSYYPYVESVDGDGRGLLKELATRAALIVTDYFPGYFLARMLEAAAGQVDVRMEVVDSNGVVPLWLPDRVYPTAHAFRQYLQRTLRDHLAVVPESNPLRSYNCGAASVPEYVLARWPMTSRRVLNPGRELRLRFPCDVAPAPLRGGSEAGGELLEEFLGDRLGRYADDRNGPELAATTELSPYLHFGHVSAHELVSRVLRGEGWHISRLAASVAGHRQGWWGVSEPAEALLDQVITWRDMGYVFATQRPDDHDSYEALPSWAKKTLAEHAQDPREHLYDLDAFDAGSTHDPLWNAAQQQLRVEGRIHNYLRMLWGKKILEWSPSPQDAFEVMVELNNRYALDGRDPNSYTGILWVLGGFDRAWGPERDVFGKVRYMSSANTARKVDVDDYIASYS